MKDIKPLSPLGFNQLNSPESPWVTHLPISSKYFSQFINQVERPYPTEGQNKTPTLWAYAAQSSSPLEVKFNNVVNRNEVNSYVRAAYLQYKSNAPYEPLIWMSAAQYAKEHPNATGNEVSQFMIHERNHMKEFWDNTEAQQQPEWQKIFKDALGTLKGFTNAPISGESISVGPISGGIASVAIGAAGRMIDRADKEYFAPERQADALENKARILKLLANNPGVFPAVFKDLDVDLRDRYGFDMLMGQQLAVYDIPADIDYQTILQDQDFKNKSSFKDLRFSNDNGKTVEVKSEKTINDMAKDFMKTRSSGQGTLSPQSIADISALRKKMEEDLRSQETEARYQLEIGDAHAQFSFLSQFVGFVDKDLAAKLDLIGNTYFKIQDVLHVYEKGGMGDWTMAFSIESLAFALVSSLFNSGPSAQEIMMDMLTKVQSQIRDLHVAMSQGFEGIQHHLQVVHEDLIRRLDDIKMLNLVSINHISLLQEKIQGIKQSLDQLRKRTEEQTQTLHLEDFEKAVDKCLAPDVTEVSMENTGEIKDCYKTFKFTAKSTAADPIFNPNVQTKGVDLSELPHKIKEYYNQQSPFASEYLPLPILFLINFANSHLKAGFYAHPTISNFSIWGMGMDAAIDLLERWPKQARKTFKEGNLLDINKSLEELKESVEPYRAFAKKLVSKGEDRKNVLDRGLELYLFSLGVLANAYRRAAIAFLQDPFYNKTIPEAMANEVKIDLFNDDQLEGYTSPNLRAAKLSSQENFIPGAPTEIKISNKFKKLIPPTWLMSEVYNLGHLEATFRIVGFQKHKYKVIRSKMLIDPLARGEGGDEIGHLYEIFDPITKDRRTIQVMYSNRDYEEKKKEYEDLVEGKWGVHIFEVNVNYVDHKTGKKIPLIKRKLQGEDTTFARLIHRDKPSQARVDYLFKSLMPSLMGSPPSSPTVSDLYDINNHPEITEKQKEVVKKHKDALRREFLELINQCYRENVSHTSYEEDLLNAFHLVSAMDVLFSSYWMLAIPAEKNNSPLLLNSIYEPSIMSPENPLFQKEWDKLSSFNKIEDITTIRNTSPDELNPYQLAVKMMDEEVRKIIGKDGFVPGPMFDVDSRLERLEVLTDEVMKPE